MSRLSALATLLRALPARLSPWLVRLGEAMAAAGRGAMAAVGRVRWWRTLRALVLFGLGLGLGTVLPYGVWLDHRVAAKFDQLTQDQPSRVYARALQLTPGLRLDADTLLLELSAARYQSATPPLVAGTYQRKGERFEIHARGFIGPRGPIAAQAFVVELADGRVAKLLAAGKGGRELGEAWIDPARIATLYGPKQKERRNVPLAQVPPLLVDTLKAVEDRHFDHHPGIDALAILRALLTNLRSGEVVQGGSTLTQQLARNLFLDRRQTLERKARELVLALVIELRYSKDTILEAYLNEVYLGQQGAQAVHGVAAAAEFYFGRDLANLDPAQVALLVGMIKGPSLYDPRRKPERATERRAVVLGVMHDAGLIDAKALASASKAPLGVKDVASLARNRHPAFLDLVRQQLRTQFPDSALRSAGLAIHTTLAPSAQLQAERAVSERLAALGKDGTALQAALVLTDSRSGAVEALVGSRDPAAQGFNRALSARRPIGSLVKPFVYLLALAQPQRWSLASPLDDRAISVPLPGGKSWEPANNDKIEHGQVLLVDALARSYNLASVRLGLEVEPARVRTLLEALVPGSRIEPHPSLLLGAVDLTPLQVTQAYQYLAAGGRPLPLHALTAVIDAEGLPLVPQPEPPVASDAVAAARLVGYALQETTRTGSAQELAKLGLAKLNVAGKTGTSNDQRDSWFAGWTGRHLAVVWLGADDNSATRFYGATGAMRVWAELFGKLPSEALDLELGSGDTELVQVDTMQQLQVQADCPDVRALPFISGYAPPLAENCGWNADPWLAQAGPESYTEPFATLDAEAPWAQWQSGQQDHDPPRGDPRRDASRPSDRYRENRAARLALERSQREAFAREQQWERDQAERGGWNREPTPRRRDRYDDRYERYNDEPPWPGEREHRDDRRWRDEDDYYEDEENGWR